MQDYQRDSGNAPVFPQAKGNLVESYFLKLNLEHHALWIKFTFLKGPVRAKGTADVWAIWFERQNSQVWKTSYSPSECSLSGPAPGLQFGESQWSGNRCSGRLENGSGEIRWNLQLTALEEPLYLLGHDFLYADAFPGMKILSPQPAALLSGTVNVQGSEYRIENAPGMQGHNWGRRHSYHYAWGHCNAFENESPSVYFEGFSARIKLGSVITPYLSMAVLHVDGQLLRWTSLLKAASHRVSSDETSWNFVFDSAEYRLTGRMVSPQFAALDYVNPNGQISLCRNSKQAHVELELSNKKTGQSRSLRSDAAALELLDLTERRQSL